MDFYGNGKYVLATTYAAWLLSDRGYDYKKVCEMWGDETPFACIALDKEQFKKHIAEDFDHPVTDADILNWLDEATCDTLEPIAEACIRNKTWAFATMPDPKNGRGCVFADWIFTNPLAPDAPLALTEYMNETSAGTPRTVFDTIRAAVKTKAEKERTFGRFRVEGDELYCALEKDAATIANLLNHLGEPVDVSRTTNYYYRVFRQS